MRVCTLTRNYVARYRLHNLDARETRGRERVALKFGMYVRMTRDEAFDAR